MQSLCTLKLCNLYAHLCLCRFYAGPPIWGPKLYTELPKVQFYAVSMHIYANQATLKNRCSLCSWHFADGERLQDC
jgi:hypothetical protein